jgi:hypothetical protein
MCRLVVSIFSDRIALLLDVFGGCAIKPSGTSRRRLFRSKLRLCPLFRLSASINVHNSVRYSV